METVFDIEKKPLTPIMKVSQFLTDHRKNLVFYWLVDKKTSVVVQSQTPSILSSLPTRKKYKELPINVRKKVNVISKALPHYLAYPDHFIDAAVYPLRSGKVGVGYLTGVAKKGFELYLDGEYGLKDIKIWVSWSGFPTDLEL